MFIIVKENIAIPKQDRLSHHWDNYGIFTPYLALSGADPEGSAPGARSP